jgi:type I restriction enzyme M protein
VLTGELRSKIDRIWNDFWSGGISNPLEVMEQLTYLLFLKRLDDLQLVKERKASRLREPIQDPIFPEGSDDLGTTGIARAARTRTSGGRCSRTRRRPRCTRS